MKEPFAKKNKKNKINKKRIDQKTKDAVIRYMKQCETQGKFPEDPFAELSKSTQCKKKAIRHYWVNVVDPRLNHEPFSEEENEYIYEWVEEYQKKEGNDTQIPWTLLQSEMKKKFGKFRSTNTLKNKWNARKRKLERSAGKAEENKSKKRKLEWSSSKAEENKSKKRKLEWSASKAEENKSKKIKPEQSVSKAEYSMKVDCDKSYSLENELNPKKRKFESLAKAEGQVTIECKLTIECKSTIECKKSTREAGPSAKHLIPYIMN